MAFKTKSMATEKIEKISSNEKLNTEKGKALELAISQIEKRFGKGSVMKLGEKTAAPIDVIPSGSLALDLALGVGGIPKGRITEIFGLNLLVRLPWPSISLPKLRSWER